MPKRLILFQLHYTEAVPGSGDAAAPAVRIANSSWVIGGADSNSVSWLAPALGFDPKQAQVSTSARATKQLQVAYPVW